MLAMLREHADMSQGFVLAVEEEAILLREHFIHAQTLSGESN